MKKILKKIFSRRIIIAGYSLAGIERLDKVLRSGYQSVGFFERGEKIPGTWKLSTSGSIVVNKLLDFIKSGEAGKTKIMNSELPRQEWIIILNGLFQIFSLEVKLFFGIEIEPLSIS